MTPQERQLVDELFDRHDRRSEATEPAGFRDRSGEQMVGEPCQPASPVSDLQDLDQPCPYCHSTTVFDR